MSDLLAVCGCPSRGSHGMEFSVRGRRWAALLLLLSWTCVSASWLGGNSPGAGFLRNRRHYTEQQEHRNYGDHIALRHKGDIGPEDEFEPGENEALGFMLPRRRSPARIHPSASWPPVTRLPAFKPPEIQSFASRSSDLPYVSRSPELHQPFHTPPGIHSFASRPSEDFPHISRPLSNRPIVSRVHRPGSLSSGFPVPPPHSIGLGSSASRFNHEPSTFPHSKRVPPHRSSKHSYRPDYDEFDYPNHKHHTPDSDDPEFHSEPNDDFDIDGFYDFLHDTNLLHGVDLLHFGMNDPYGGDVSDWLEPRHPDVQNSDVFPESIYMNVSSDNKLQCFVIPNDESPSTPTLPTDLIRKIHDLNLEDNDDDMGAIGNVLDIVGGISDVDFRELLEDSHESRSSEGIDSGLTDQIPELHRRKRSPSPRRGGGGSRSRSSSSSGSRSSSSRSSGSRSSGSSSSGSGSRWSWGSRSSSSSSNRGSSSTSRNTNRIAAGTAVVGGAAIGTAVAVDSSSSRKPSAPPYPTSGGTASSPYPTASRPSASAPTASAPYPTSGSGYPTASAPYPTSGSGNPTASAPYPTSGSGNPTASAPYPTSGSRYPTASAPYPTSGSGYPTASAPYPTSGSGYPTASAPYPTSGGGYPTASAPYPTGGRPNTAAAPYPAAAAPYPSAPYPGVGGRPTFGHPYPSAPYPSAGRPNMGNSYPGASYPNSRYPGGAAFPGSQAYPSSGGYHSGTHYGGGTYIMPKKTKTQKVKQAVKVAIAGYALHKAQKKVRKGFFSPSIFSSHHSYGGYGGGFGGYGGYGGGFGGFGRGGMSGLGTAAAIHTGGKVAKKILGAYVKIQIAKYALKFGVEAAKIYFSHRLGYDLREDAIEKFIRQHERRTQRRLNAFGARAGSLGLGAYNVTAGAECARVCRANDTKLCHFTFRVHLYQTLSRACYDCPGNLTDCLRPECVTGGGQRRLLTLVNRQLPGPAIEVCHGDRVLVEVQNELPAAGVTLHWHGLTMDDDQYMDGVDGLTQCSIRPRDKFMYSFKANYPGTHFWHGQTGLQRGDGLYGPLIVRKPDDEEPNKLFYDHDLTAHVLTISDLAARDTESLYAERYFNGEQTPRASILINGRAGEHSGSTLVRPFARINIVKDKRYRVRIINAAALNCPFRIVAPPGHNFTIISADGSSVSAFYTHSLVVYNGERWDVVLTADQTPGLYWLTVLGEGECDGLSQSVVVSYKASVPDPLIDAANSTNTNQTVFPDHILGTQEDTDVPTETMISSDASVLRANTHSENCSSPNITCVHEMRSLVFAPVPPHLTEPWVEDTFFLAFGTLPVYNHHFYSLLYYGPNFMPPEKRSRTPQINNLSLKLPAKPLLLDQSPLNRESCSADGVRRKDCVGDYCECLHLHHANVGDIVELVLINEGRANETLPQPFHLHGHRFWVLGQDVYNSTAADITRPVNATADSATTTSELDANETDASLPQPSDENGFTRLHALNMFSNNHFVRNFWHPIMKDTIMIPPGGYTIVRFQAYNKGFWLGESQVLLQSTVGQAFVLQVGNITALPKPPLGFNSC